MPTEEELELLTPEERAGLEQDDDQDDDTGDDTHDSEQDDADADDDADEDDADGQDEEGDGEGDADDDQDGDADADDGQPGRDDGADQDDQGQPGEDEAPNPDRPVVPEFTLEKPEGVEEKLAAIDTQEDELTDKFDEGDITASEYRKGLRELGKARDELNWSVRKYEQAFDRHKEDVGRAQEQYMQNWFKAAGEFVKSHPELTRNKTVMQVFDNIVQGVNTEENINKLSHSARLEMAYKQWAEDLGVDVKQPAGKGKDKGKQPTPPKKRDLPPTLGNIPAADVNETDNGAFGTLNRLFNSSNPKEVARAEDMLSKMSEADQDRYLRSN